MTTATNEERGLSKTEVMMMSGSEVEGRGEVHVPRVHQLRSGMQRQTEDGSPHGYDLHQTENATTYRPVL